MAPHCPRKTGLCPAWQRPSKTVCEHYFGSPPRAPPRGSPLPGTVALFVGRPLLGRFSPAPARVTGRAHAMHHDSCRAAGDPLEGPLYPGPRHFSWGGCPLAPSPLTNCLCVLMGPNFEGGCHARKRLAREIDGDARRGRHRGKWHHIARGRQASPLRGISP